jgi:ABC-type multidrug transport system ATPase subunit
MNRPRRGYRTASFNVGFLKDLNDKGTTIILTTHYLEEAEMLCRNIGIIHAVSWWKTPR